MRTLLFSAFAVALIVANGAPANADATRWSVKHDASTIAFSGQHAGRDFSGTFTTWRADVRFDPADFAASKAIVRVDLASAVTGDQTYDKTLPTADWFHPAFPK